MLTNEMLLKVVAAEAEKSLEGVRIPTGLHTINATVTVQIVGAVDQKPPQMYKPTAHIPILDSMAGLAQLAGEEMYRRIMADHPKSGKRRAVQLRIAVRNRLLRYVKQAAENALIRGEQVADWMECSKEALREVETRVTSILPKQERAGQLKRTVSVTILTVDTDQRQSA